MASRERAGHDEARRAADPGELVVEDADIPKRRYHGVIGAVNIGDSDDAFGVLDAPVVRLHRYGRKQREHSDGHQSQQGVGPPGRESPV